MELLENTQGKYQFRCLNGKVIIYDTTVKHYLWEKVLESKIIIEQTSYVWNTGTFDEMIEKLLGAHNRASNEEDLKKVDFFNRYYYQTTADLYFKARGEWGIIKDNKVEIVNPKLNCLSNFFIVKVNE